MRECSDLAPRGRLAPTPSGRLHWGNLRSALLAWLQIRLQGGTMVLRIEDLDQGRARPALREEFLRDLAWLGLDWDEGPDVGGPYGPYLQSQRASFYHAAVKQLAPYACNCSRTQIAQDRARGFFPVCLRCRERNTPASSAHARRWALPAELPEFQDLRLGTVRARGREDIDDPVLFGRDGLARYTLAVVVDDAAMKIDTVCRGADLLVDTHRQIALAQALGYAIPSYFHLPLVLGPDGQKLSKSKGAPCLHELRAQGSPASQVVAALAQSCGLVPQSCSSITPGALLKEIDLAHLYAVS